MRHDQDFELVRGFGAPRADSSHNVRVALQRLGIARGKRVNAQAVFRRIARRFGFLPMEHVRREAMRWLASKTTPMRDTGPDFRRLPDGSIDPKWAGNLILAAARLGVTTGSRGDAATLLAEIEKRFGFRPAKYAKYNALLWLNLQPPCVDRGKK